MTNIKTTLVIPEDNCDCCACTCSNTLETIIRGASVDIAILLQSFGLEAPIGTNWDYYIDQLHFIFKEDRGKIVKVALFDENSIKERKERRTPRFKLEADRKTKVINKDFKVDIIKDPSTGQNRTEITYIMPSVVSASFSATDDIAPLQWEIVIEVNSEIIKLNSDNQDLFGTDTIRIYPQNGFNVIDSLYAEVLAEQNKQIRGY